MLFLSKRKFYIRFRRRGIWNWVYCWISKASCWNHIYLFSWFGCSDHHPNALSSPFSSLSLSLSLCTSALSQILISQTLDSLKLQKNPQFHNHPLSLSLSLSVRVLGALSNPVSVCVRFAFLDLSRSLSFSFLLKFRDPTTVRFLIWRKASSIYQTISSHLSRPITPGPPKVLPTTTTSPRSSRSLLHSFAFNVYRCFFFFFLLLDLRTYLMDLIDADSMRGLGLCWSETISNSLCSTISFSVFFFNLSFVN